MNPWLQLLSSGAVVGTIEASYGTIINPLTTSGHILAAGLDGSPVVSTVYPEWIASFMEEQTLYPLPRSLSCGASFLFPAKVQAFYDAALEPAFDVGTGSLVALKRRLPDAVAVLVVAAVDVGCTAGLVLHSLSGLGALVALIAAIAIFKHGQPGKSAARA